MVFKVYWVPNLEKHLDLKHYVHPIEKLKVCHAGRHYIKFSNKNIACWETIKNQPREDNTNLIQV